MKKIINLPISDTAAIRTLHSGDIIYLSGTLVTGRDEVYRRCVHENIPLPLDISGAAIFHAGPIIRETNGVRELIAIGPTSSIRMEQWAADFIKKTGIRIMIGKGGMGRRTSAACSEYTAIHCIYPGGCAVLGAAQTEAVENVFWQDLGMPEALWLVRVRELGPLIVSIDTHGNNLFAEHAACYASRSQEHSALIQEFISKETAGAGQ